MISIIDYDAGNIKSVEKALLHLGQEAVITRDPEIILNSDKIILPGVGAFGDAMDRLRSYSLDKVIKEAVEKKIPFLGICLGLQLLFDSSEEAPGVKGLGILPGKIIRFPETEGYKIPHMGWNSIHIKEGAKLFKEVPQDSYVYFVHSYYLEAENPEDVAAKAEYITEIHASVEHENVYACQFHPEKSSAVGLQILKNFVEL